MRALVRGNSQIVVFLSHPVPFCRAVGDMIVVNESRVDTSPIQTIFKVISMLQQAHLFLSV